MGFNVSIILDELGYLEPERGMDIHGANLSIAAELREFGARDEVQTLELFVPPKHIADRPQMERWASLILPKRRQGRGILRIMPMTSLPEVWADGAERILWSRDPWFLPRERYVRDRFAKGPTPLMVDTHSLGQTHQNEQLSRLAGWPRVEHDVVCALTSPVAEAYRRIYTHWLTPGIEPPFSIDVLERSVDHMMFRPAGEDGKKLARRTLGLPEDGTIALYFGRLTPNSKADLMPLLHAFAEVMRSGRHLVICGVENVAGYVDRLKQEAVDRGIAGQVFFLPAMPPSMRHLPYASADFFVFPGDTVQEALGNTMLEAAASGLPALISAWDGMKEVCVDGETGLHVPCYWMDCQDRVGALHPILPEMTSYLMMAQTVWIDPIKLAQGLERLFADGPLRERLGSNARKRVEQFYTPDRIWEKTTSLWNRALEIARREPDEARQARCERAKEKGLAMPILDIFAHYASGVVDPSRDLLSLTSFGEACLAGSREVQFYDECLPLINPKALAALRKMPWHAPNLVGLVAEQMSSESGATLSDSRLQIAFLLKRGVFCLTVGE